MQVAVLFIQEMRKETGENYPATTLQQMLLAFQRVLRSNKVLFNIFDKTNLHFIQLHNTLDMVCVGLRKQGVGAEVAHMPVISIEHETLMWTIGVLGFEPLEALLHAVFVTVRLHCSFRGGQEHYDLKVKQFTRLPGGYLAAETHYRYMENGSKNYQGRFSKCGKGNKIVKVFAEPESDRCPVHVLIMYFSKLPDYPTSILFQWLPRGPEDSSQPWYKTVQVGINPLKKMMPTVSESANVPVRYTNHSLRATAATRNVHLRCAREDREQSHWAQELDSTVHI